MNSFASFLIFGRSEHQGKVTTFYRRSLALPHGPAEWVFLLLVGHDQGVLDFHLFWEELAISIESVIVYAFRNIYVAYSSWMLVY